MLVLVPAAQTGGAGEDHWVGTWMSAQQLVEPGNLPPAPGFADATLRQVMHVSLGGRVLRVRFSNEFGRAPLTLVSARIARSAGGSAIDAATDRALTFGGRAAATIPGGAALISDPVAFDLPPLSNLAVSIHVRGAPPDVTGHPGSRTTSYLQAGDAVSAPALPEAVAGRSLVLRVRHRGPRAARGGRALSSSATRSPTGEDRPPTATIAGPTCSPGACRRRPPPRRWAC